MAFEKKEISGTVEGANADGYKVGGQWFNKGNYYKGPELSKGQNVVMTVSGKYITTATVVGGTSVAASPATATSGATSSPGGYNPDSQRLSIHRQVALKEAGENIRHATKAGSPVDVENVLGTAARIETWLNRPFGTASAVVTASTEDDSDDE